MSCRRRPELGAHSTAYHLTVTSLIATCDWSAPFGTRCATSQPEVAMPRIAVPVAGTRVSPLFDVARTLLVADIDGGEVTSRERYEVRSAPPAGRAQQLANLGAATLMCGGISRPMAMMVQGQGIGLVPWVAGEVEEVLAAYATGRLPDPQFMMPGCRGRCRGRARGRQGRGSWWDQF